MATGGRWWQETVARYWVQTNKELVLKLLSNMETFLLLERYEVAQCWVIPLNAISPWSGNQMLDSGLSWGLLLSKAIGYKLIAWLKSALLLMEHLAEWGPSLETTRSSLVGNSCSRHSTALHKYLSILSSSSPRQDQTLSLPAAPVWRGLDALGHRETWKQGGDEHGRSGACHVLEIPLGEFTCWSSTTNDSNGHYFLRTYYGPAQH